MVPNLVERTEPLEVTVIVPSLCCTTEKESERLILTVFPVSRLVAVATSGPAPRISPSLKTKKFKTSGAVGWMRTGKLHNSPAANVTGPCTSRSMYGCVASAVPARASTLSTRAAVTPARRFIWTSPSFGWNCELRSSCLLLLSGSWRSSTLGLSGGKRDRDAFEPESGTSVDIPNERFRVGFEDAEQGLICGHDGRVDEADCLSLVRHLGGSCPEAVGPGAQVADGSARLVVLDEVGRRLLRVPWCHRTDPTPEGHCANRVFPYVLVSSPPGRAPIRAPSSARVRSIDVGAPSLSKIWSASDSAVAAARLCFVRRSS